MIDIPAAFAEATIGHAGEAGRRWLTRLPDLVAILCQRWQLSIDGAPRFGHLGMVWPVHHGHKPAVLKVAWPDGSTAQEALALATWNGHGAARLLAAQPAHGAVLLERLDAARSLGTLGLIESLQVAGTLLRRLAIPAPPGLPHLTHIAAQLADAFPQRWRELGRPFSARLLERACEIARQRGPHAANCMVHYDLHDDNVLAGTREPWLAIDPKIVVGDPEYGIAQLLWRRLDEIEGSTTIDLTGCMHLLIDSAGLDPTAAHDWTLVRCVDYWLWGLSIRLTDDPVRCQKMTAWLLGLMGETPSA